MNYQGFTATLNCLNVHEYGNEFRIKGFLIHFIPTCDYALLQGKIPYSLATAIYEQREKYNIDMEYYYTHPVEDKNNRFEQLYIRQIQIESVEALQFVVQTVREFPFINEWAIGNY